jgi:hypothetical protein
MKKEKVSMNHVKRVLLGVASVLPMMVSPASALMPPDGRLYPGEYLFTYQNITHGCYYRTVMQGDGNLVTYAGAPSASSALWATGTRSGYAVLQYDGNFVIRDWADTPVWDIGLSWSGTSERTPAPVYLQQQDDGNLVLHANDFSGDRIAWASGAAWRPQTQLCTQNQEKTQVSVDTDCPGSNYQTIPISVRRPSWCGYYCAIDPNCKAYAYTYPAPDGSPAACWLKNAVPAKNYLYGAVCGVKVH